MSELTRTAPTGRYSFQGRTAIVTGAASGIGEALAHALAPRAATSPCSTSRRRPSPGSPRP